MEPERFAELVRDVEREVGKVIVGQRDLVRAVVVCLVTESHALLEGVPGLGKTMLLRTLGDALSVMFSRVQFTPDLMPADIVGTQVLAPDGSVRFQEGPVFTNLLLADEINRATPKTQSALLEAMQERAVTVSGTTRALPRPFFVMATQNPIEMEGTYPLPEAQLDRFAFKILVGFPAEDELVEVLVRTTGTATPAVTPVASRDDLVEMQGLVRQVPVAEHLLRYAVTLVGATHPAAPGAPAPVRTYVRYGASPRAAQAMILAAKAMALIDGRLNVSAEDIRAVAPLALRHRVVLGYEAVADDRSADDVVGAVLDAHAAPALEASSR